MTENRVRGVDSKGSRTNDCVYMRVETTKKEG